MAGPYVIVCDEPPIPLDQLELIAWCESNSGWLEFDLSSLAIEPSSGSIIPPMTIEDAFVIGGAIIILWIVAYGTRALIHLFHGYRY